MSRKSETHYFGDGCDPPHVDSRLSGECDHTCCLNRRNYGYREPGHLHLFPAEQCPTCREESQARHPTGKTT
jgi:hypothetical protein